VCLSGSEVLLEWKQTENELRVDLTGVLTERYGYVLEITLEKYENESMKFRKRTRIVLKIKA